MGHKIKYIQQTGSYQKDDHNLKKSTERKSKIGRTISPAAGKMNLPGTIRLDTWYTWDNQK